MEIAKNVSTQFDRIYVALLVIFPLFHSKTYFKFYRWRYDRLASAPAVANASYLD